MSDEHAWVFFLNKKKYILEKIIQACPMNLLGNRNHVFFYVGENKYPRMFIVHVWNIFSVVLFFLKRKKKPRMSQDIHGFFFYWWITTQVLWTYLVFFQFPIWASTVVSQDRELGPKAKYRVVQFKYLTLVKSVFEKVILTKFQNTPYFFIFLDAL